MHLTLIGTSAARDRLHARQAPLVAGKEEKTRNVGVNEIAIIATARAELPTVDDAALTQALTRAGLVGAAPPRAILKTRILLMQLMQPLQSPPVVSPVLFLELAP